MSGFGQHVLRGCGDVVTSAVASDSVRDVDDDNHDGCGLRVNFGFEK